MNESEFGRVLRDTLDSEARPANPVSFDQVIVRGRHRQRRVRAVTAAGIAAAGIVGGTLLTQLHPTGADDEGHDSEPPVFSATSPSVSSVSSSPPASPASPPSGPVKETSGSNTNTWSNYRNAGGTQGATLDPQQTVEVSCRIVGFRVDDGNTWWYRIHSRPWNDRFYASADAFYNNGSTSGQLKGTPFFDPAVPRCAEEQSQP